MMRRLKVLQLQNRYNVSAADLAEQIIKSLPAERYEVTTAFLRGRPRADEPHSCAARSVYFDFSQSATKGLRLRALWALYRHCRDSRYDVVIGHRFKPINLFMLLNLLLKFPACIGVLHGLGEYDRRYRQWLMRRLMAPTWRFVGVSRAVRNDLLQSHCALHEGNTVQINNAIDIARAEGLQHSPEQARRLLGLNPDAFIFGTIGRLVPVKGHIHLISAFAELASEFPRAQVAIIGDGRMRAKLQEAIARHGLQPRVHLLGAKDDALQYVRAFDAFVMPSLSEGLPLALLEGMSGHLPVLGSDIDSLRPILEDSGGRVFPSGNASALAARMREILQQTPQDLAAEGERAYAYLCRAHSIEDFRSHYRELIENLSRNRCD